MAQVWARFKDNITGHEYDVTLERLDMLLARGAGVEVTTGPSGSRHAGKPRPAKPRRPLGTPAPNPKRAAKAQPAVAEPKESESK